MDLTIEQCGTQINKTNAEVEVLFDELEMLIEKKICDKYRAEDKSEFIVLRKKEKEMRALGEDREDNRALFEKWLELMTESKKVVEDLVERAEETHKARYKRLLLKKIKFIESIIKPISNTGHMLLGLGICTILIGYLSQMLTTGNESLADMVLGYIVSFLRGTIALMILYLAVGHVWYYMSISGLPERIKKDLDEDMGMMSLRFELPQFWGGRLFYVSIVVAIIIGMMFPI